MSRVSTNGEFNAARDPLLPVEVAIPGPRKRRYAQCRAGLIPGAVKIGREWLIRESALAAYLPAAAEDDAIAEMLAKRGYTR